MSAPEAISRSAAVMNQPGCQNGNWQGLGACAPQIFAPGKPLKLLSKLITEQQAYDARRATELTEREELSRVLAQIQSTAGREEWSQVETAKRVGLPRTTWQYLCAGHGAPATYLPKLRTVAARLQCEGSAN